MAVSELALLGVNEREHKTSGPSPNTSCCAFKGRWPTSQAVEPQMNRFAGYLTKPLSVGGPVLIDRDPIRCPAEQPLVIQSLRF